MIKVLVLEDDNYKFGKVRSVLIDGGVDEKSIFHAINAAHALEMLGDNVFDLLLLDVNIPRRFGESPVRGAGLQFLAGLRRTGDLKLPRYIVGLTAYGDVYAEFGEKFSEHLWTLVLYSETSDLWASQLKSKIEYINAAQNSSNFSDGVTYGTDLAIICALDKVELGAVRNLDCAWQPLRLEHDETRYFSGTIRTNGKPISVIAAAAPRMGMPASSVLTSKIIARFRPRFLAMVGICAGRSGKTALGDIIVADPCWDWGSGKIDTVENKPLFRPSPHQIELDIDAATQLREICEDVGLLATIKKVARGNKPAAELRAHFGPMASGAAVVANQETFNALVDRQRDILGIEMEAYGVAAACKGLGKPRPVSMVIKSVCDFADKDKDDDYQEYAAHTSALFLFHAIQVLIAPE